MENKSKQSANRVGEGKLANDKARGKSIGRPIDLPVGQENVFVVSTKKKDQQAKDR